MENIARTKPLIANLNKLTPFKRIIPADRGLMQKAVASFRPDSKNYEDSWGYIIQATRYGGFKWHDEQSGSLIFFGRKSETESTLVVPSFFAKLDYLTYVITKVQKELRDSQTILKNVKLEDIPRLTSLGFRQYKKNEEWCKEARFDDQTFPQLIINLKKLMAKKGNLYKKLRTALNKNPKITIRKCRKTDSNEVVKIFTSKDGILNSSKKSKGMYHSSHTMYLNADINKFIIADGRTGEILGFTATSDISSKNTALVAAIFKPGVKIASIWGIYQTLKIKYEQGCEYANLGGHEKVGSFNFMRRTFVPVEQHQKTHLIYDP